MTTEQIIAGLQNMHDRFQDGWGNSPEITKYLLRQAMQRLKEADYNYVNAVGNSFTVVAGQNYTVTASEVTTGEALCARVFNG